MIDKAIHLRAAPVSIVSQKSFGLIKGGATTVKDKGLDYLHYVLIMFERQSSVGSCRFYFSFVFIYN